MSRQEFSERSGCHFPLGPPRPGSRYPTEKLRPHTAGASSLSFSPPTALTRFEEAVELLKSTGLAPIPKLFRGSLDGRMYPRSYTELDKSRFRLFCDNARELYQPLFESNDETPTIDMFRDDEHLDGVPSFAGMSCDAGRRFVRIESNGDVYGCGPGEWFGNVLDRTFVPRPGPTPCNTEYQGR